MWLDFDLDTDRLRCFKFPLDRLPSSSRRGWLHEALAGTPPVEETGGCRAKESDTPLLLVPDHSLSRHRNTPLQRDDTADNSAVPPPGGGPGGDVSEDHPLSAQDAILLIPAGTPAELVEKLQVSFGERFHFHFAGQDRDERDPLEPVRRVKRRLWKGNYLRLRELLQEDNASFRGRMGAIQRHLPLELRNLKGLPQRSGHSGLDPLDHTIGALAQSSHSEFMDELFSMNPSYPEWVRCALLFHDLGKKIDPFDLSHAPLSARMARFHLECMEYSPEEVTVILRLIATHSLLGEVRREIVGLEEACGTLVGGLPRMIPPPLMVDLNYEVTKADISSIRVLEGISLEEEYRALRKMAVDAS